MKNIRLILILLLICGISYAQDKQASEKKTSRSFQLYDDPCGDPAVESQLYENREGKITKIIKANKVIFEQSIVNGNKEKGTYMVELVGIDSSRNKTKIIEFLKKYILNHEVEITGNLRNKFDKKFKGIIFVASDDEEINWISENLLEQGIAKYKDFESANLVSFVEPCKLKRAEETAKKAKLGIWAK